MSETFINRLVAGFLVPAIETEDHLERWKAVNRCAGLIVGYAFARAWSEATYDAEAGLSLRSVGEAQRLLIEAIRATRPLVADVKDQRAVTAVLGENGLRKRVRECLRLMIEAGGGS